jgi:hypothetical protein
MIGAIMESKREASQLEIEIANFVRLSLYKEVLKTSPEEWGGVRTEFISLCIPESIITYIKKSIGYPEKSSIDQFNLYLSILITDLLSRGISSIANQLQDTDALYEQIRITAQKIKKIRNEELKTDGMA